jgi:quinol monooxygenase YgiN
VTVVEIGRMWIESSADPSSWGAGAIAAVSADPACESVSLYRCVEVPHQLVIVAVWESVEAHEAFRAGPGRAAFRAACRGVVEGPPDYAHYELLAG